MNKNRLTLTFEGLPSESGKLRLREFVKSLDLFCSVTSRMDKAMSDDKSRTFYYRIVELKYSSPATVIIEPQQLKPKKPMNIAAISKTVSFGKDIEQGNIKGRIDLPFLKDMQQLAGHIEKGMNSMNISFNEEMFKITKEFKAKVELALAPKESYPGSVRGALEFINIHGSQKVFRIYSEIEPKMVKCYFPGDLINEAIRAVGKHVEVRGILSYKSVARYPDEIQAKEIETFPDDEELPTIIDLKGSVPNLTGGLSSGEFVRKIRNAAKD